LVCRCQTQTPGGQRHGPSRQKWLAMPPLVSSDAVWRKGGREAVYLAVAHRAVLPLRLPTAHGGTSACAAQFVPRYAIPAAASPAPAWKAPAPLAQSGAMPGVSLARADA